MVRENQKHLNLINWKYFRIHYSGAYAWMEIDFGRVGHGEFVLLLGCVDKLVNWVYYKPENKAVFEDIAY